MTHFNFSFVRFRKQLTLAFALLLCVGTGFQASAQTFSEFFQGGIPSTWTVVNRDMLTPNMNVAYVTDAWVAISDTSILANANPNDSSVISTSWYSPAGRSDDWIISPAINVGMNEAVSWSARAVDPSFPDGYEVYALSSASIPATLPTPLFSVGSENAAWTRRTSSLSAFNNQTVYLAWRNNSNDQFLLMLDSIVVDVPPQTIDVEVLGITGTEYFFQNELHLQELNMSATITNNGGVAAPMAAVEAQVFDVNNSATTPVFTGNSTPITLAAGATQTVSVGNYTPTDTGVYLIQFVASTSGTDLNPSNDSAAQVFATVSDFYSRPTNSLTGTFGIGGTGSDGILGQNYDLEVADVVDTVLAAFFDVNLGTTVTAVIYNTNANGVPTGNPLATSAPYTFTANDTGANVINQRFGFATPVVLQPGEYFFGVEESGENMRLTYASQYFTEGEHFAFFNNAWQALEQANPAFRFSFLIRPNFDRSGCLPFSSQISVTDVSCSGNSDGAISVAPQQGTPPYTYAWGDGATGASRVGLAAGTYSVMITDANGCDETESIVVNEPAAIAITPAVTDVNCNGEATGRIQTIVQGGTAPYTYSWSNGSATASLTNVPAGSYTLTVTDANGCNQMTTETVNEPATALSGSVAATNDDGTGNGTATATAAGGTPPYTYNWSAGTPNGNMVSGLTGGMSVTVTITDANGCTVMESVEVLTVSIDENLLGFNAFTVFPNPTEAVAQVEVTLSDRTDLTLEVVNAQGKVVVSRDFSQVRNLAESIDLSEQATGVYIVRLRTEAGTTTRRLIKE